MDRRGFLGAILVAGVAPAIIKASSLMKVSSSGLLESQYGIWSSEQLIKLEVPNVLLTIDQITRKTLVILENELRVPSAAIMSDRLSRICDDAGGFIIKRPQRFSLNG